MKEEVDGSWQTGRRRRTYCIPFCADGGATSQRDKPAATALHPRQPRLQLTPFCVICHAVEAAGGVGEIGVEVVVVVVVFAVELPD